MTLLKLTITLIRSTLFFFLAENTEECWPRSPLPRIDPKRDKVVFQQIDIEETTEPPNEHVTPHLRGKSAVPVFSMFGVNDNGNSIMCHVHGFYPYYYTPAPRGMQPSDCEYVRGILNAHLGRQQLRGMGGESDAIVRLEMCMKQSLYGYQGPDKIPFLRVYVSNPRNLTTIKGCLEAGLKLGKFDNVTFTAFESNLPFTLRFTVDCKIVGCNWVELPAGSYLIRPEERKQSRCQLEIDVSYTSIVSHEPEGDWSKIAPLRILSFDIECAGRRGIFPDPKIDPIIQIANVVKVQNGSAPFVKNIFCLDTCASIVGSHILSFENEAAMLQAWSDFVARVDPDIVTGYNINNFDFPYLLDRASALRVERFPYLGRFKNAKTEAKDTRFSSRAFGTRDSKDVNLDGRLKFDALQIIQRDYKLRSYTLNSVSAHFLGEQKEDVHHSIITDLQNGNEETRRRLAVYCLKDAHLPMRLLDKLMCVINYMEMARVTGVPFNYLLTRGQQVKVISQLFRKAMVEDLVVPVMEVNQGGAGNGGEDVSYEGATVIEPVRGYYDTPIATLDFNSLYPSIMQAHNLCYSTLLLPSTAEKLNLQKDIDFVVTPTNDLFVRQSVRKGLLPTILADLLSARKRAKAELKKETDPFKRAVLDGRQLALKISANSVYGFTGATIGKLPCLAISSSVTGYGREMIEQTKLLVEEKFTRKNGYSSDAQVIYGDTDSVMIKFGLPELEPTMDLGREAAAMVTATFQKPINLEFEKCYFPYLLISKKRYAGLYWTNPKAYDKLDAKGIESVRRDNCQLVSNVIDICLHRMLMERDKDGAIEFAKQIISDLLQNKVDMSQLVITKALTKTEYDAKQAHVILAERMRKRDPGSAPNLGDRVAYVIIKGAKDARAYEKSEDPLYVLENNLPIDTQYYLHNQLAKPLLRIFEPVLGDKAQSILLAGDHTRTIHIAAPSSMGGLFKFAKKKATCLGCKTVLKDSERVVCAHCSSDLPKLYAQQVASVNKLETKFARLWTQCQRCQGSLHQDVICTSKDCPIFYMRKKVQKDATDARIQLERFQYDW